MSDDETPQEAPTEAAIPDVDPAGSDAPVFVYDRASLSFRCDALRLIFRKLRDDETPKFGVMLADMVSGDAMVFEAEWFHGPNGTRLAILVPVREVYALGDSRYSRERLKQILDAALTAYHQSHYDEAYDWTAVSGSVRFVRDVAAPEPSAETPAGVAAPALVPPPVKRPLPWLRWVAMTIASFFVWSILSVAVHRYVPVPITILMIERLVQGNGLDHRWVGASKISDNLRAAVIASEDEKFCSHNGFDVEAIEKAQKYNATHTKKRGASTISQQTAKNVFLWPDRSWLRKGFEVYYTFLIEHMWPKERIMTVYLNSVEWAPGVYGAEAASQHWFHHSAATLSKAEAAKLAAILPSPLTYKTTGRYVVRQSGTIQARARAVDNGGLDACAAD